ncbi:MAG: CusA/CzcA family heavy metal efflux RND transporter [Bacteroidetes bacterium HGW-Bacteroidetes-13]|nr:MAG: CusA/CzcA family heavy metal efflux RND transporter [Bacteroidetes bacterium HGW-Bacteroidetes-13]
MLNQIIQFSIKNKLVIGLLTLGLILYGIYEATKLPIDAVPDITDNQVQIITSAPSLGATDIELLITAPIEQASNNIPGLKQIRSFSRFGLSLVTLVFNDDVDVYWARQQVSERMQIIQANIPMGAEMPYMAPVTTGLGEIYQYVVKAKKGYESKYSLADLRTIQDWIVRRQLIGTEGVADVSTFGGNLKQYEVAVNPDRLKAFDLTITDVFIALEQNNANTGGAYIEKGPTVLYIRSEGIAKKLEDLESIVVKTVDGVPVLIRDVAKVGFGSAIRYGAVTYNGEQEVVAAIVMMLKGGNSSQVIKDVKERIVKIQETLPEGVVIEPFLDRTKMVNNAINTVKTNLIEGALIVLFVLIFFLGNIRAGFLVASVIPLSLLFAIIMMNMFGVGGNLMSMGALDFGLIVDGAVIIVEAILHQLTHSKHFEGIRRISQKEMDKTVKDSSSRMMNAAVFGQIIILIVYLPILTLEGIEGKMFGPMAKTVGFAILGAFILSLTYVPMMSALFLSKKLNHQPNWSDRIMLQIEKHYQHQLERFLNYKRTVLTVAFAVFLISVYILSTFGGEFIPKLEEGDFAVDTRVLTGSNLSTTIESTKQTARVLIDNFPEVEKVVTKIGSGEIPTDPMPIEASDMMVILKDKKEWTSAKSFEELAEKMSEKIATIPGVTAGFQFPVQMRFNELMTGARQDVVCKIFGENLDTLALYAEKLGEVVKKIEGAKDLYVEKVQGMPQIVIHYKRDVLAQFGINIDQVNKTVNTAFAGGIAGQIYEGEKRFDLVVRFSGNQRKDLQDVQNLLISTPTGMQVPLRQLADVEEIEGPNQVQRENSFRRIIVGFNVRGKDVQSVVNELEQKVAQSVKFPPGYSVTYGGAFENLQAAKQRLLIAVPVAMLLIFMMLYFAFSSIKEGLLIFSAIPLSAIGGILALWTRGMPFSISAGVGFIALFGVAVLNGIVLISEFNRLKKEGWTDLRKIVIMGTKIRLRPVLMTAAVASLGFLPMALSNGAGAEVQRPLATVVIGGLISATVLTLMVLPALYVLFETVQIKVKSKNMKKGLTICLLLVSLSGISQTKTREIGLESALKIAEANNLNLKNSSLNAREMEARSKTWFDVQKTDIGFEYGEFNSAENDIKFTLSQTFAFPTVYSHQKQMLNERFLAAKALRELSLVELKGTVMKRYYEVLMLKNKQNLLRKSDSLYAAFEEKSNHRFEAGETNILEKTTAESLRQQINIQLEMLNRDLSISLQEFNYLLNDSVLYSPDSKANPVLLTATNDTIGISAHPVLQAKDHLRLADKAAWKTAGSKLLPDITLGYNNMSFAGMQSSNGQTQFYDRSQRFSSFSFGLGIPLFFGSQTAQKKAAQVQYLKADNEYAAAKQRLLSDVEIARKKVQQHQTEFDYYANQGLQQANTLISVANQQFNEGEIDFLQYTLLINRGIEIQTGYWEALNKMNLSKIDLQILRNQL